MGERADDDRQYGKLFPVARAVLRPLFRAAWKIRTIGGDNLPRTGPAILCPNHTSVLDSFLLPAVLPRRITFVGKAEYLDDWKTKHLFPALGMIPIDRAGGDAAQRALDVAARVLTRHELFGIYPEGTRSRDGRLYRGRTGAARLALRTGAPLVPVGIVGTRYIQPPGASVPRPFRACEIRIGRPIDVTGHHDDDDDRLLLRRITDELMYEIRELSGQEYVDAYAGKRPSAASADAPAAPGREPGTVEVGGRTAASGSPAAGLRVFVDEDTPLESRRSSAEVLTARPLAGTPGQAGGPAA